MQLSCHCFSSHSVPQLLACASCAIYAVEDGWLMTNARERVLANTSTCGCTDVRTFRSSSRGCRNKINIVNNIAPFRTSQCACISISFLRNLSAPTFSFALLLFATRDEPVRFRYYAILLFQDSQPFDVLSSPRFPPVHVIKRIASPLTSRVLSNNLSWNTVQQLFMPVN